jgi:hypothetical protein
MSAIKRWRVDAGAVARPRSRANRKDAGEAKGRAVGQPVSPRLPGTRLRWRTNDPPDQQRSRYSANAAVAIATLVQASRSAIGVRP